MQYAVQREQAGPVPDIRVTVDIRNKYTCKSLCSIYNGVSVTVSCEFTVIPLISNSVLWKKAKQIFIKRVNKQYLDAIDIQF